ncbi:hypothetical protein DRN38_00145 [Thermococci archaeon]|nr:MAG: hypothetical protein DRN38_00145 [Thermococci archaeon]
MKKIKINVNGEEKEGFLIEKTYSRKRKRRGNDKDYEWLEEYIIFYIPSSLRGKKWIVIPL